MTEEELLQVLKNRLRLDIKRDDYGNGVDVRLLWKDRSGELHEICTGWFDVTPSAE